nr:HAD-IIIA family hydrolase [Xanthobacter agilis]
MAVVKQCVILLGGLGTRLGALTADTPKPLLPVGDIPFVEVLIAEARRRGFTRFLLLAGHRAEVVADYIDRTDVRGRFDARVEICVEPTPLGTGGALVNALPRLEETFLLLNGDTWFDFNWLDLAAQTLAHDSDVGMSLRLVEKPDRYETIVLEGARIAAFRPRGAGLDTALINGGVYVMRRRAIETLACPSSVESDLLPRLVAEGKATGIAYPGFFIDIGIPETYADAQVSVPARRRRPAVFLDRDGVLNVDTGYPHRPEDITWVPGAKAAVKRFNDIGFYTFVVTNQAGVARGYYAEADIAALHAWMGEELRAVGASIDDWRYCPFHPEGSVARYTGAHPWRKPAPGMLLDLLAHWPVDVKESLLIGDKASDLQAATGAGVEGHLFTGGDLITFVEGLHPVAARQPANR